MLPIAPPLLILASASPRRAELLGQIGAKFTVVPADILEEKHSDESPENFVVRMAKEKATAVLRQREKKLLENTQDSTWVLASDTSIVLDGTVLGKPRDAKHAYSMWQSMSGRKHQVLTSLCLMSQTQCLEHLSVNEVEFHSISDSQMKAYWHSGEPQDKAGAYAIQGKAALWISHISGSYSSIMGLPLFDAGQLLEAAGFELWP